MASDKITKADLAREMKVSPACVTKWCHKGLPVLADGRLDRTVALQWIYRNALSWLGGWEMRPHRLTPRADLPSLRMPGMNITAKGWRDLRR